MREVHASSPDTGPVLLCILGLGLTDITFRIASNGLRPSIGSGFITYRREYGSSA
jgi:hypothetical protein